MADIARKHMCILCVTPDFASCNLYFMQSSMVSKKKKYELYGPAKSVKNRAINKFDPQKKAHMYVCEMSFGFMPN